MFRPSVSLRQWADSLTYAQLRNAESPHPLQRPDGKRLRGVMLTPTLCLARDRLFYEVTAHGMIHTRTALDVQQQYTIAQIKQLFLYATLRATQARKSCSV